MVTSINQPVTPIQVPSVLDIVKMGKKMGLQICDLAEEFQSKNSCCFTCYSKIWEKLKAHKSDHKDYITIVDLLTKLRILVANPLSSDEIARMTQPADASKRLSELVENQFHLDMQTISRTICVREYVASSRVMRGIKWIIRSPWTTYQTLNKIHFFVQSSIDHAIFTKKSNSLRDYIAPLALIGGAFYLNGLLKYGLLYLLIKEFFNSQVVDRVVEKSGLNTYDFTQIKSIFKDPSFSKDFKIPGLEKMIDRAKSEKPCKSFKQMHPFHSCITSPVLEEIFDRGIVQNGITFLSGSHLLGLLASSALFGSAHFQGDLGRIIKTGLGGLFYGIINNHYGILYSIYFHSLWNLYCSRANLNK